MSPVRTLATLAGAAGALYFASRKQWIHAGALAAGALAVRLTAPPDPLDGARLGYWHDEEAVRYAGPAMDFHKGIRSKAAQPDGTVVVTWRDGVQQLYERDGGEEADFWHPIGLLIPPSGGVSFLPKTGA